MYNKSNWSNNFIHGYFLQEHPPNYSSCQKNFPLANIECDQNHAAAIPNDSIDCGDDTFAYRCQTKEGYLNKKNDPWTPCVIDNNCAYYGNCKDLISMCEEKQKKYDPENSSFQFFSCVNINENVESFSVKCT